MQAKLFTLLDEDSPLGDPNTIPKEIWIIIISFLSAKDFISLRLTAQFLKTIIDGKFFLWEPKKVDSKNARMLRFNLGVPVGATDTYSLAAQHGEYRWPGGFLLMCRSDNHAIDVMQLTYDFKSGVPACKKVTSLLGHTSPISFLKSFHDSVFISGDHSGSVNIWNQGSNDQIEGTSLNTAAQHKTAITAIARTKAGHLFTGDNAGRLCYWTSHFHPPIWAIDLSRCIVSIKVLPNAKPEEIEIVSFNSDKSLFKIEFYHISNGALVRSLKDLNFGLSFSKLQFSSFTSFENGMYSECRSETSPYNEVDQSTTISVWNSKVSPEKDGYIPSVSYFHPSEKVEDFLNHQATPFCNGNILFWKKTGEARLFYQKRSPVCVGTPDKPKGKPFATVLAEIAPKRTVPVFVDEPDESNEANLIY